MEPLPTGRSSPMATVNGGKLWVLGGTSGTRCEVQWHGSFMPKLTPAR